MKNYFGRFNYQGEIHELRTRRPCPNASMAFRVLTSALSKKLGRTASSTRLYFNGSHDNYEIREESKG